VLRDEPRTAAGLNGREGLVSLSVPGERSIIRFTWHFSGVPGNSFAPEILLTVSANLAHQLAGCGKTILHGQKAFKTAKRFT
jgi:hypothetical protein